MQCVVAKCPTPTSTEGYFRSFTDTMGKEYYAWRTSWFSSFMVVVSSPMTGLIRQLLIRILNFVLITLRVESESYDRF